MVVLRPTLDEFVGRGVIGGRSLEWPAANRDGGGGGDGGAPAAAAVRAAMDLSVATPLLIV